MEISISDEPVPPAPALASGVWGADLAFLGRVRGTEDGRTITGIEYTAYRDMALQELEKIVSAMQSEHGAHPVRIHHTTGFVAAGEPSILIAVGVVALGYVAGRWLYQKDTEVEDRRRAAFRISVA